MEKQLLSVLFPVLLFFLNAVSVFGQCPSSVSISTDTGTTICAGTEVTFTASPSGGDNLHFTWQVDNADVATGTTYKTTSLTNGQKVKVVVTSTTEECTTSSSEITMTVNSVRTPTVSITSNKTSICPGENITFSAKNTNGGSSPKYEWFINNSTAVSKTGESVTFSSTDFTEEINAVKVMLTSNLDCVANDGFAEATSEVTLKPDATISDPTNKDQTVCINESVQNISFTIGGGGTGATVSGLPSGVSGSFNSGTYTISGTPTTAGNFPYTVTTTGTCAQTTTSGTITVNPDATIALTSGNNSQTVCAAGGVGEGSIQAITYSVGETGTGATVTGLPTGIAGSYSNGIFTIQGSSSITGTHDYSIKATGDCGDSVPLTGSITITENKTPSVTISSSDDDNIICAGTEVTFTATPTIGGTTPSYQWKIGDSDIGTNSPTFTTSNLTDGQSVTVIMSSSETCLTAASATSSAITTTVNPNLTPEVSIETSDTEFCAGDEVTYTAIPVNGGTAPSYEWKVGSSVVGSGNVYTTSTLTDGQSITVTITSNETCVTASTAVSDPVVVSVNENLVPLVTITSNDDNEIICAGSSITFTATPTNGGTNPEYQWQINGTASGGVTTSNTFSPASLNNGDKVTAVLISNEECLAENNVVSNEIPVQVDTSITVLDPVWDNSKTSYNPTAICPVVSGLIYKVNPLDGATSYDWTFPTGWTVTGGTETNEVTVTAGTSAAAGKITVRGRNECGISAIADLDVTTGTTVYVEAGPDTEVCPGTTTVNLAGEIGGVITKNQDWDWLASVDGGEFSSNGFSGGGNALDGTYSIPTSVSNGGTVVIRMISIDPAGSCELKTDDRIITILPAASITDPANKNQTICINSEIENIAFTVGGAAKGAETAGLPAGIAGNFEDGIFTLGGTPTQAGTFNYTVTTTGDCENAQISGTLTINDRPTFTQPSELFACVGESIPAITFEGSSVAGTSYNWTNDNTAIGLAASGTGNINSFEATNTTNGPITANIIVTPVAETCEGTPQEFQITVYPEASVNKPENIVVCNSSSISEINFSGSNVEGTTYEWINDNVDIGLGASGTGDISAFTAVNNTSQPIVANITLTPVANGCEGTTETFTVTVNPTTGFSQPEDIVVCNSESTSEVIFADSTVDGTTFSWINDNPAIGLAASGTGNLPVFSATNSGTEPIIANITVTPESNECEGIDQTFQITVNPNPNVTKPATVELCNGETFSGTAFTGDIAGTTYAWSNNNPQIGLSESGTGDIPSFTAVNETEEPVTALISVTPSSNGCEGQPTEFEFVINPSTIVVAGPDQIICSSGTAIMAASLSGGASSGAWSSNGSGTFSDNSLTAVYTPGPTDVTNETIILTFTTNNPEGPCASASDSLELTIYEEVAITTQPENIGICSTEPSELNVIASGDNLTYEWKRTDGANIVNSNGIYSSTLSFNNTTSTHSGEYYVIVRGEDTCNEVESERVTINVDENIIIDEPSEEIPICGDGFSEANMRVIAHAADAPLAFIWFKDGVQVDDSDPKITITGPTLVEGKYHGTLSINGVTVDYNGDYYVEITGPDNFTCSTAVTNPFQVRLNEMPTLPEVEDLVVCQNETPGAFNVITGTDLKWYLNEEDTEHIVNEAGQPTAPVPSTEVPGDYYYWVTQQPEACESEKVQVKVTVQPKPEIPALTAEEAIVEFCLGETAAPLTATVTTDVTLNWYNSENGNKLDSAPTPNTAEVSETKYWVSQTPNDGLGCESDRAEILVKVYALPEVTISVDETITLSEEGNPVICSGSEIILNGNGATEYLWSTDTADLGSSLTLPVSPEATTTYYITGTDVNGCTNSAEITIEVDPVTVTGTLEAPESVCVNNPAGTVQLIDYVGEIIKWEYQVEGQTSWEILNAGSIDSTQQFSGLTGTTIFRATVKSGVCEEKIVESTVTLDPLPVGGKVTFNDLVSADNDGTYFMICEGATSGYLPLTLSESVGTIVAWKYRSGTGAWLNVPGTDGNFTETTLAASQIQALNLRETTVFRVEIASGACVPNAFSQTAIISVIPTDIKPSPVTVSDDVVCLGESVTLSSETGYTDGLPTVEGGAFDNAGIKNNGWRFGLDGNDANFETNANNTNQDFWSRATPHDFNTADYDDSPYPMTPQRWDAGNEDGNKGFALVSGDHNATMETNVFAIGSMDQAIVTFDQAYNLTPGATITVEISKDGGATYEEILFTMSGSATSGNYSSFGTGTPSTRPKNKMVLDLGNYLGENNLRIKFTFDGARDGDLWAVDAIKLPQGPRGITMEWNDYTNPDSPILIGTTNSVQYVPTKVGLNIFEVKTKLVFDSAGNTCEVAENAENIEVFVFDKYTTSVTADYGSCGNFQAKLTATVVNGINDTIRSYPTPDGYVGSWKIEGSATLVDSDPADGIDAVNDPNAILSTDATGTYSVSWILEPTAVDENGNLYANPEDCPPVVNSLDVVIEGCIALDFDGENDYIVIDDPYSNVVSIEAWIRPEVAGGTIISGPNFKVSTPAGVTPNERWYHIAVTDGKLYIDGIDNGSLSLGSGGSKTLIGAEWVNGEATNFFSGWIEEVRFWNTSITQDQIQFMMNQRLKAGANIGEQIPMPAPGGIDFTALAGYYRLISAEPDPANLVNFAAELLPADGVTPNLANAALPGRLINMETNQQNTAPLPYFSANDGLWATDGTWARPEVWDPPHTGPIEWNIVRTSNNIQSGTREIKVLGLISEVNTLQMDGTYDLSGWNTAGTGNPLYISHYLKLDGIIDLVGESQLLQPNGSIVDAASTGYLERDQQGTANSYNYNYWSSPVSSGTGNVPYTVAGVLQDGTDPANPKGIEFGDPYAFADAGKTNPIKISDYWISIFNGVADLYGDWEFQYGSEGTIQVGEGYTMKGTSGPVSIPTAQNYVFAGKPNNGDILLSVDPNTNYLLGNPYASAISIREFILDNLSPQDVTGGRNTHNTFNGALYFWEHFGQKDSHILLDYVGGYATGNLVGGVPAASVDYRIDQTGKYGKKIPGDFVPVGQGFFINTVIDSLGIAGAGGKLLFQNSQRFFIPDANGNEGEAVFLRPENHSKEAKAQARPKIRLGYISPLNFKRQILVGVDPNTTNGFDLGYDAPLNDYNSEDMYWIQDNNWLVIQGVPDFEKDQVLPLGIILKEKGEFTIQIDKLENIADDKNIYLKDKLLDTVHDLRASSYKIKAEGGFHNDRFEIVFFKEVATDTEPPVVDKPKPDPGLPGGDGEIPDDITNLTIRYSHTRQEIQILNPDQVPLSNMYIFDLNGNQLINYRNISHDKDVRVPVRNYSSGVYIVKLYSEGNVVNKKIIINN